MVKIDIADIPTDPTARKEWIKYQLRLRGWTLSQLSRAHSGSRHCAILAMRQPYPRWERIIAEKLNLKPEVLWPERYDSNGKPNRHMGRPARKVSNQDHNNTDSKRGRNVHGKEAA